MKKNIFIAIISFTTLLLFSILVIIGVTVRIPNYIRVPGIKLNKTISFYNDGYNLLLHQTLNIYDSLNNIYTGVITNIDDRKIYLQSSNIPDHLNIVTVKLKNNSLTLFEYLVKEAGIN